MIQTSVSIAAKSGKMRQIHWFLRKIYPYWVFIHWLCCIPEGLAAEYPHRLAAMGATKRAPLRSQTRGLTAEATLPDKQYVVTWISLPDAASLSL